MDEVMLLDEEMLVRLEEARSAKDVIAIAREFGREIAPEQAVELFDRVKNVASSEAAWQNWE